MEEVSWQIVLFYAANSLYIVSYSVTSIVWLRILTVLAALTTLPYFIFQYETLWSAVFWQSMFAAVNIFHLTLLYIKSLPTRLTGLEAQMKSLVFRTLPVPDMRKFLKLADVRTYQNQERLLRQGQSNSRLYVLMEGSCFVVRDDQQVAKLLPGQFVGEISFLTDQQVSADIIVDQQARVVSWSGDDLKKLFVKESSLHQYFSNLLGNDMAVKLSA